MVCIVVAGVADVGPVRQAGPAGAPGLAGGPQGRVVAEEHEAHAVKTGLKSGFRMNVKERRQKERNRNIIGVVTDQRLGGTPLCQELLRRGAARVLRPPLHPQRPLRPLREHGGRERRPQRRRCLHPRRSGNGAKGDLDKRADGAVVQSVQGS